MNRRPPRSAASERRDAASRGAGRVALWHAAWAATAAIFALAGQLSGLLDETASISLILMALPGVAGVLLTARDGAGARLLVLGLWLLAAVAAAGLTGGITGALPGLAFMPLAAGVALEHARPNEERLTMVGAGAVGATIISGLISSWLNGPSLNSPLMASISGLIAVAAVLSAMRLTWGERRERLSEANSVRAQVEALLNHQPALTMLLDRSARATAVWGTPPPALAVEDVTGRGLISAVHAPDRPAVATAVARALGGLAAEVLFTPRAALDRRVILVLRRLESDAGQPRLIAQAFDGTAQFARELGLENARLEAEAESAGKTRFLANMSHELRTPLNAVLGFADIMRQRLFGPLPDRYVGYADSIHQAGRHLLDMINDVLDLSKIEAERYQLSMDAFDARDPVSDAVALMRVQADDRGVELASVLPSTPVCVTADRRALKQIALNLLSNALKFTAEGGAVTVVLEVIGPNLELSVSDTGVGIAPEDLSRLGRPFEQAGDARQKAQGTGLGLSLVRSLAELHGGRVSIDSTLGEGTSILVRLPVISPSESDTGRELKALEPGRTPEQIDA